MVVFDILIFLSLGLLCFTWYVFNRQQEAYLNPHSIHYQHQQIVSLDVGLYEQLLRDLMN